MAGVVSSERKPVCKACYKELENCIRRTCTHSSHVQVTVAASPCGSVFLHPGARPSPRLPSRYNGAYKVCKRANGGCRYGMSCRFAHSEEECVVWNVGKGLYGIYHQICLRCVKDFLEKMKELQKAVCTADHFGQDGFIDSFLWTREVTDRHVQEATLRVQVSIVRPIPSNVAMMRQRGFQYKFRHSHYDCRFQHVGCYHPHGSDEEVQWNTWRSSAEGWTPVKLHDSAVAKYQRSQIEAVAREQARTAVAAQIHSQYWRNRKIPVEISRLGELKISNYKDWFHSLLCLEEESIKEELKKKQLLSFLVKDEERVDDHTYTLTVQMTNEDAQFLCKHAHSIEVKLILSQSPLTPSCRAEPVDTVEEGLQVKCYFNTRTRLQSVQQLQVRLCQAKSWDKKHTAIEELPATMVQRVLPSIVDFATELPSRSRNDDWYETQVVLHEKILELDQIFQQEAADAIMSSPPGPPFLLTGPFGTGKTRLIARLTHQILHTVSGSRVLISTHHHQTADTYPWNFFAKLRNYRLPCVVYRLLPDGKVPPYPQIIHNVLDCSAWQLLHYHRGENVRLVVTTNVTALRLIHDVKLPSGYFTHIFIDEAAQCIEPEALIPLLLAGPNTKVILAGDHLQVGPEDDVRNELARKHGFTRSLLTRLHERYTKLGTEMILGGGSRRRRVAESPLVRQFTANLLTNYRCDANILRLPSNLFYECSLLARAQHELHPSTNSSLVFVCTSLAAPSAASSSSAAQHSEVRLLLDIATKLLKQWPEQWDEYGKKNSVCFMARTPQQRSTMKSQIKSNVSLDAKFSSHELQLRSTYNIQGQEYTVVFLLTTEPHAVVGGRVVPRQQSLGASIVNKRVFNTVLTRARTLFVAIGNPMYLLQAETNAPDGGSCWKEYLRRCIESSSIQLPSNCTDAQRQALLHAAFDDHDPLGRSCVSDVEDTILDTYSWEFLRKLDFVGGSWRIPKLVDEDSDDDEEYNSINRGLAQVSLDSWTLQCTSAHQARAIPELPGGREFAIEGLKSRGQALDGARVVVKALGDSLGKVVSVVKQSPIRLFLCRTDTFNSNLFVPLNGKGPKLANLPAVSRKLIQIDKAVDEFEERQKGHLAYKKYPIACYDLSGLEKDPPVPKLRDVIPRETAKNLVFIVRFIEWKGDNVYPMAAVVGTFPIAHTEFHGNRLIRAMSKGPSKESEVEEMKKNMVLARRCFQSSQFHPKAVVTKAEGKSFFVKLEGNPCKDLEAQQPAFRVGCEKSTEQLDVSWRFKMCSTKSPEVVLRNLSQMIIFNNPSPLQRRDLIYITLVVTDKNSKKSEVVKGWTDPNVSTRTPQELPSGILRRFAGKHISLYSFSIKCSVTEGQVLPVWVGANTGGLVIQPEVQLVRPAPYLDLCMQHSTRPAQCFSSPVLHNASIGRYKDVYEYIELWESALLAEAAESSVKDGELLFVDQATLLWDEDCFKEVTDLLKEPSFVYEGEVTLSLDEDFMSRCGRFVQLNTGDFVCARYEVPQVEPGSVKAFNPYDPVKRAIYHFVVQSVRSLKAQQGDDKKESQLVQMKMVGERNAVVSKTMRQLVNHVPCTLQVIQCMIPQRRMYESLLQLKQGRNSFVRQVVACGHVSLVRPENLETHVGNGYAFLSGNPLFTQLWSHAQRMNTKQVQAMQKALKYKFSLIQGPPGTGKSVTGAHLAYLFAEHNRLYGVAQDGRPPCVLYCAPSNKATDVVLGYLHELVVRHGSQVRILRIYSRGMEYQTKGAGPRMNEEIFKQIITDKCPPEFLRYALHDKVSRTQCGPVIKELEASFQRMKESGQIPSAEGERLYHHYLSAGEQEVFNKEKFDIILCTCNEAASLRVKRHLHVCQCIVDECGYAVEPDAMIPLQLSQQVVLIGDHKQLQPVIKNSIAGDNGLNRSLFERYADMYTKAKERTRVAEEACAFTQLEEQYRMHEAICQPPSDLFYNKTLKTAYSVSIGWREYRGRFRSTFRSPFPSQETPLLFCNVVGRERSPQSSTTQGGGPESKQNWDEADVVVKLVQEFKRGLTPLPPNSNVDDIVVLTPYRGQKDCISRKLENIGWDSVPVKTVNESQGSEANIVILSTVRSMSPGEFDPELLRGDIGWAREHLGFITDPHQICVAISRSKFGFIVVGNGRLLSCDQTWNKIITNHFKKNGCFVDRYF